MGSPHGFGDSFSRLVPSKGCSCSFFLCLGEAGEPPYSGPPPPIRGTFMEPRAGHY
jgi:hypothetical protein